MLLQEKSISRFPESANSVWIFLPALSDLLMDCRCEMKSQDVVYCVANQAMIFLKAKSAVKSGK